MNLHLSFLFTINLIFVYEIDLFSENFLHGHTHGKMFQSESHVHAGFSRRAGDRRFSPCTKVYHAGYKFWIHFIFGTTLNVSTKETKRFLLSAYKVLCKCRICSYKCCKFSKFPGGACSRTLLDDPPLTSILSPPTMLHLGEP